MNAKLLNESREIGSIESHNRVCLPIYCGAERHFVVWIAQLWSPTVRHLNLNSSCADHVEQFLDFSDAKAGGYHMFPSRQDRFILQDERR